jgi:hypothetical protein
MSAVVQAILGCYADGSQKPDQVLDERLGMLLVNSTGLTLRGLRPQLDRLQAGYARRPEQLHQARMAIYRSFD